MSDKCYSCGQRRREEPLTLREQWLEADLFEKVMSMFFSVLMVGAVGLMILGLAALTLEIANAY